MGIFLEFNFVPNLKTTFGVIKENGEVRNLEPKRYYPNDGTFIVPWSGYVRFFRKH
jgi:hypothetical protein